MSAPDVVSIKKRQAIACRLHKCGNFRNNIPIFRASRPPPAFNDICNYWEVENMGFFSAKIDEQKTEETKQKIIDLVAKL